MPVYFIRAGETGPVKIGTATDVAVRVAQIQKHNHERLHLVRAIEGAQNLEQWLHRRFSHLRLHGEWFSFDEAMLTVQPPHIADPVSHGFRAVMDLWQTRTALAVALSSAMGARPDLVQQWYARNAIPRAHFGAIVDAAQRAGFAHVTPDLLATIAANRRAA